MKKNLIVIFMIILGAFAFIPYEAKALSFNKVRYSLANTQAAGNEQVTATQEDCSPAGLLGDPNDEDSVAWLLQKVFNYVKIIGPILVVILSSIDFLKVIFTGDDDAMKKAQKKLITRLVLALLLFFIPSFVQILLNMFGITANPTCGIK